MSRARRAAAPSLARDGAAGAVSDAAIEAAILGLTEARAPESAWRPLMGEVRRVAAVLAAEGRLAVTQRGLPASTAAKGPIRLAAPAAHGAGSNRPARR